MRGSATGCLASAATIALILAGWGPVPAVPGPGFASLAAGEQAAVRTVTFPTADGGTVEADAYGEGSHAVLLAHGRIFDKDSWAPLAQRLAASGYRVLAINFRGYGASTAGRAGAGPEALHQDVLAAIRFLHRQPGVTAVSVLGGSMGGGAAARAAVRVEPGEIEALVLLSAGTRSPERLRAARILFVASEDEPLTPGVLEQYARAPDPKKLVLLPGNAHAQHIFATDQAERLTRTVLDFLAGPGFR